MDLFKTADEAARDFSLEAAISSLSSDNVLTRFRIMPVHMPSWKKGLIRYQGIGGGSSGKRLAFIRFIRL